MTKLAGKAAGIGLLFAAGVMPVLAVSPDTSGQPRQRRQAEPPTPSGFNTSGFTLATGVYAGTPGTPPYSNGGPTAVSQYDAACFPVSDIS